MTEEKETVLDPDGLEIAAGTLRDAGLFGKELYVTLVGPGMILILDGRDFVVDEAFLEKFLSLRKPDVPEYEQSL